MIRERDLQRLILDFLRVHHILAVRINNGAVKLGKRFVRFTDTKGVADILGCVNSRFFAIECKAVNGDQSRCQTEFQASVERNGGVYCLARDLKDVEIMLRGMR